MSLNIDRIRELENTPEAELISLILKKKKEMGSDLCILAHLYQRKAIQDLADFTGDSYGLSKKASEFSGGKFIVFCGVRFMAESAALLCRPEQKVIHPDPEAGCPMADMAHIDEVKRSWTELSKYGDFVPVTYMNSTADIKAFCGENGGLICTSSNAVKSYIWSYQKKDKIFFLPDEHLGRNTALQYGLNLDQTSVWDPEVQGGGESEKYAESRVVLWKGHCPVHKKFSLRDVEHVRHYFPDAKVVVHPECPKEVVEASDAVGSTKYICDYVESETKPGDVIYIGTEINLVDKLSHQYPDRKIEKLHRSLCLTMYQITLGRLYYSLENLESLETVQLDDSVIQYARVALDRMLELG